VKMNGRLRKVAFMVMALPYSDASFVMAFERECTETFWEGHVQGSSFSGRAMAHHLRQHENRGGTDHRRGKDRRLTRGFCQLKSHYLFNHHFCRVARAMKRAWWRAR